MLTKCPACGGELEIRELACKRCSTRIIGKFKRTPFEYLSEEQLMFLLEFLKSWGNFSEVARKLKLSYPTVRSRYAEILRVLGLEEEK